MVDLVVTAIPFFVAFIVIEVVSLWFAPDDDEVGYEVRDTVTSLSMGLGSVAVGIAYKALQLVVYAALYAVTPLRLDTSLWWVWVVIFVAEDLAYYWYHRAHHEVRILWASHVVHHSSRRYNLSTALRQTWTPFGGIPFWAPLALLGVPPWAIFLQQSISLLYQFFLHTERVGKLWRPLELVMNTPSHHRVHHGTNNAYLDRNYGGILIVWDRLFRSFQPERERVVYGLTKQLRTYNPLVVATHEYAAIWRDVRAAASWRDRVGHVVRGPGWQPQG
ncbi:sterol desaturase family protein [Terrabacter sp. MAHUQ-38]|uniref:sterol desaturase family protein n=1 Tax=unclassified Terrabacter TaxID=2630222 RepID=UPI00165E2E95|nr:sterol desaturase family protein [Terrabacter sp. MAHUQ-38]MBC9820087.1 sterol desaturase family protein [Terrabacter sp. MAHUQ-38]